MKKILCMLLALCMIFALAACAASGEKTPEAGKTDDLVTVRVGCLNQQLSIPLYYISQKGWDVENGFKLELSYFAQGSGINEALGAGLIDVFTIGAAGVNSCVIYDAVYLYSHENSSAGQQFMVRADSPIAQAKGQLADHPDVLGSAETIKGSEFLLPMATAAQLLADVYLDAFGLTEDDVTMINISDDASTYQAFVSGEGDFAKTSYPSADNYSDDYVVAVGMESIGVPYWDHFFASRDFHTNNREVLEKVVVQMIRAAEDFKDSDLMFQIMKDWYTHCGVTVENIDEKKHQVTERPFFTYDELTQIDRASAFDSIASFYAQVGTITQENYDKIAKDNMDDTVIAAALEAYAAQYIK